MLLKNIHQSLIQAQFNQDLPFEQLVAELNVKQDESRHPIFQVMFSVQSLEIETNSKLNQYFTTESLRGIYNIAKFDLTCFIDDSGDPIKGVINYATTLFNQSTILRFIDHYKLVLVQLVDNIDNRAIQDYSL